MKLIYVDAAALRNAYHVIVIMKHGGHIEGYFKELEEIEEYKGTLQKFKLHLMNVDNDGTKDLDSSNIEKIHIISRTLTTY